MVPHLDSPVPNRNCLLVDVVTEWGPRYPCGLHADNNGAEKIIITLNKLYSSVDARSVGARACVVSHLKQLSHQAKLFTVMRSTGKLKGVAGRMENRVSNHYCKWRTTD